MSDRGEPDNIDNINAANLMRGGKKRLRKSLTFHLQRENLDHLSERAGELLPGRPSEIFKIFRRNRFIELAALN